MAIRSRVGLNAWIPERLQQIGMSEEELLDEFQDWNPCFFGYYDYAEALELLSLSDIEKLAGLLGSSAVEILRRDYEPYIGLPLAELIRTRREDLHLSVEQLAKLMGYESAVVERLEQGINEAPLATLREVASALGIPLELLVVAPS